MTRPSWIQNIVKNSNIFAAYDKKYGAKSDYHKTQQLFFQDPDVSACWQQAIKKVDFRSGNILDIGINNGNEITQISQSDKDIDWEKTHVTGIDLSTSALKAAQKNLDEFNTTLLNGDILDGAGERAGTGRQEVIADKHFDWCVAVTSLQSTSITERISPENLMSQLESKMKQNSSFMIVTPNISVKDGEFQAGGMHDPETGGQLPGQAQQFTDACRRRLQKHGYETDVFGDKFIFLVANR